MKTTKEPILTNANLMKIKKLFRQKSLLALIPMLACIMSTGCASIINGTTQKIKIDSTPSDATVVVKQLNSVTEANVWEGKTPAVVKLSRTKSYLVVVSREGYRSVETPVEYKSMSGWIWGNILFGGPLGCIIDGMDGAASNLGPDKIAVELVAARKRTVSQPAEAANSNPNEGAKTETNAVPNKVQ